MHRILVFYDSADLDFAKEIAGRLDAMSFDPWLADEHVRTNWEEDVKKEILSKNCVGAIVIWTKNSTKNTIVKDEATFTRKNHKTLLNLLVDDTEELPFGNSDGPRLQINSKPVEQALKAVEARIISVFPDPYERKRGLKLNGKFLEAPSLILSVSSFETQIATQDSLELLKLAGPEAILISAYDLLRPKKKPEISKTEIIQEMRASGTIVFLDSGNYEAMRFKDPNWQRSKKRLAEAVKHADVDVAFTHDKLPKELSNRATVDVDQRVNEVVTEYNRDNDIMNCLVAPIIHAPRRKNNRYESSKLPEICMKVVKEIRPQLIAVAERELGNGILERAVTIAKIRKALARQGLEVFLHILGTGNPISAAMLSKAGADFFDGLEWCRTAIEGESWRLFHFQQWDFFAANTGAIDSDAIAELLKDPPPELPWHTKVALHNIAFFDQASKKIRKYHQDDKYDVLFSSLSMKHEYHLLTEALKRVSS